MIRAVVFDVGQTLVDETSQWRAEALALGVTPFTLFAALGAVIERRGHHRDTWSLIGRERVAANRPSFTADDLYPDALPCLRAVHEAGFVVGVAGNQPERAESVLRGFDAPVDLIATSAGWGIEKPSLRFFERIARELDLPAAAIAYVGDRLDTDHPGPGGRDGRCAHPSRAVGPHPRELARGRRGRPSHRVPRRGARAAPPVKAPTSEAPWTTLVGW